MNKEDHQASISQPHDEVTHDSNNVKVQPIRSTSDHTASSKKEAPSKRDAFLRPPHEDDDGYDPYSDRIISNTMWEEDPWR